MSKMSCLTLRMSSHQSILNLKNEQKIFGESRGKKCEISTLKVAFKKKKSSTNSEQNELTNKCEAIQKKDSDLQERFIANHEKMKSLEEQLKCSTSGITTPMFLNFNHCLIKILKLHN